MRALIFLGLCTLLLTQVHAQTSCSSPVTVGALPTTDYAQGCLPLATLNDNVISTVNTSLNACGTAVQREYWYAITIPAGLPNYIFDLTNGTANRDIGFQIISSTTLCSGVATNGTITSCQNATGAGGNETATVMAMAAGTYYVRVVSYNNNNVDFTLCFTKIPNPPANDNPCSAINVPVGANGVCTTVVGTNSGATASAGVPAPGCALYSGGDVWYSVTVPASGSITFATDYAASNTITDSDIAVYSGTCGSLTLLGCDDLSGNGVMGSLSMTGLTPGATLFVRVWEFGNNEYGNFNLCFSEPPVSDANQDCTTSNQLCSDATLSGASSGVGSVTDLSATNQGCLSTEHQTNWYFMVVTTAGSLAFTISPNNGSDDYDFALWNYPGGVGQTCPPSVAPTRCSFAAGSGLNSSYDTGLGQSAVDLTESAAGDNWVAPLNVAVGDVVVVVVDNFSSTTSPFTVDFTGTAGLSCLPTGLPVGLVSFSGIHETLGNKLSWEVSYETNVANYQIERKVGQNQWEVIGEVRAENVANYTFVDESYTSNEMNYYRLKNIDLDGASQELGIVAISNLGETNELKLAPNPINDVLSIQVQSTENKVAVFEIVSLTGVVLQSKEVQLHKGSTSLTEDVSQLSSGSYIVVVRTDQMCLKRSILK